MARPKKSEYKPVVFRDEYGRLVSPEDRYKLADSVWVWRGGPKKGKYVPVVEGKKNIKPDVLVDVLYQPEFESLPPAYGQERSYKPKTNKYTVWNLAEQLDKTKGIRRKMLKVDVDVMDGKRLRRVSLITRIKRSGKASYQVFRSLTRALGAKGLFEYDRIGSKILTDRRGRKVSVKGMKVSEMI